MSGFESKIELPEGYRPSEDEDFMNPRQKEYFRRKLLAWKDEILRESKTTLYALQKISVRCPIWQIARPPRPTARSNCARVTASAS